MATRREILRAITATGIAGASAYNAGTTYKQPTSGSDDRAYWVSVVKRLAEPVLVNLAGQRLKEKMPVECWAGSETDRRLYSHLEAFARLLAGIAPWLELEVKSSEEGKLRERYAELSRQALDAATDPRSRDYMNFTEGGQPLVDAAFLAQAIIRAPRELWSKLAAKSKANVIKALQATRVITPNFNNWLLFTAMIEAALAMIGEPWDRVRVEYAVRQHEQWYKGDGIYGDGANFHCDYYNSFVIQPMLLDVLKTIAKDSPEYEEWHKKVLVRARRYAEIQERMISPEGTFPAVGRSLAYRFGAFQLLGQMALLRQLPKSITAAQVRCGVTAIVRRMVEAPNTFDSQGWLTIGFCGHQPKIGEQYISTGSLYLCSVGLLPLGLPADDELWTAAAADWTAKKIWAGQNLDADHAI
ncbi:MAG: DUF2264 domain-containing protein [Acidobacteria bacterium]|nr:DUF2264 domain-containing protein [Acidobacteriota bacterium]